MIRVSLVGQLGNWLFQYAAARDLALRHGTGVTLDDSKVAHARRLLGHFSLQASFEPAWYLPKRWYRAQPTFVEGEWGYSPALHGLPNDSWLRGYFQSERYFSDVWPTLREEIKPSLAAIRGRDQAIEQALTGAASAVAVHVRRRDYLRGSLHNVCTLDYYRAAMTRLREHVAGASFFVFSDDLLWCHEHLGGDGVSVVDTGASPRQVYDLSLMAQCRHHIISNSTFSWWGAFLARNAGQRVLVPERWFNAEPQNSAAMRDTVPLVWERLPV